MQVVVEGDVDAFLRRRDCEGDGLSCEGRAVSGDVSEAEWEEDA
jgi:hypothetical protein